MFFFSFFTLADGTSQGCVPCICDPRGTVTGSVCDSTTGQCVCVPTRYGKDCSSCRPGELQIQTERRMIDESKLFEWNGEGLSNGA